MSREKRIALYGGSFDPITKAHVTLVFEVFASGLCDEIWVVPCGDHRHDKTCSASSRHRYAMCQLAFGVKSTTALDTTNDSASHLIAPENASSKCRSTHIIEEKTPKNDATLVTFPIKVLDIEVVNGFLPTAITLRRLRYLYPALHFSLLIGSDLLPQLSSWIDADYIIKSTPILVVPRGFAETGHINPNEKESALYSPVPTPVICAAYNSYFLAVTCVACALYNSKKWSLCRSDIASNEVRRRMETAQLLTEDAYKVALQGLVPPNILSYIVLHHLYGCKS